jgi:hypothetical protein
MESLVEEVCNSKGEIFGIEVCGQFHFTITT